MVNQVNGSVWGTVIQAGHIELHLHPAARERGGPAAPAPPGEEPEP